MKEFKVGQEVEVISVALENNGVFFSIGDKGTIVYIDNDGDPCVNFNEHSNDSVKGDGVWCIHQDFHDAVIIL